MYTHLLLFFHLAGAVSMLLVMAMSLISMLIGKTRALKALSFTFSGLGIYQIITGSLLAYITHSPLSTSCAKIGVYLVVLFSGQLALNKLIKKTQSLATA